MNKTELVEEIAKRADTSKAAAARSLEAFVDIVIETVAKKKEVQLIGFGTFGSSKRAARTGRNPRTGAALKIAASTIPKFKAGAAFKAAVAKKK